MIGFVVPFKASINSNDWKKDCFLLRQTVSSICNQCNVEFKVFVVTSDPIEINFSHVNLFFIHYPFPFLKAKEIEDYDYLSKIFTDRIGEYMFDQGKKTLWGASFAIKEGCSFVMSVDADDLVSNKIADFVSKNKEEAYGWFIQKGYIYREGGFMLLKVNNKLNYINGSTNIVRTNIIPIPDFNSKNSVEFNFFCSHAYLKERIKEKYEDTLKPFPFFGVVYIVHKDNWSGIGSRMRSQLIKTFAKYLLHGRFISKGIRKEFCMHRFT